jgi:hypothetical protein
MRLPAYTAWPTTYRVSRLPLSSGSRPGLALAGTCRHLGLACEEIFQSSVRDGVPALIELGHLLQITERIERDEETDDDLQLIFAPGSSLGGARPKASVIDQHGHLSIAKFPKESDDYSIETWEEIALRLAEQAGIQTPEHALLQVAGKPVLLSRRFDRVSGDTHLAGSSSRSRSQAG